MAEAPAQVVLERWRGGDSKEEDVIYQKSRCHALRQCEIDMDSMQFDSSEVETQFRNEHLREHMQTVKEEIECKR